MAQERIYWIDNLKGLFLLLVCLQHVYNDGSYLILEACKPFRIPGFLFLSGFLFNPEKHKSISLYAKGKWSSLLKPYFYISVFFLLLDPKLWLEGFHEQPSVSFKNLILHRIDCGPYIESFLFYLYVSFFSIINGLSVRIVGPIWFLWALFGSSIFFYICEKFIIYKKILLPCFVFLCGIVGYLLYYCSIRIPLSLDTVLTSTFFYGIGFLSKKKLSTIEESKQFYLLSLVCSLLLYCFGFYFNGGIDIAWNELGKGNFVWYFFSSVGGIYFIVLLSSKYLLFKIAPLIFIAKNAIPVLSMHMFVVYYCYCSYPQMNKILLVLMMFIVTFISIPMMNKYLYFLMGKKKKCFRETFSI